MSPTPRRDSGATMTPSSPDIPGRSMPELLLALGREAPGRDAVVGPEGRVTYRELVERCRRLAAMYARAGLRPGDRVGIFLPNGVRWIACALGAHLAGLTAVPINTWYRSTELRYVIETGGLRLIVAEERIFGRHVRDDLEAAGHGELYREPGEGFLGTVYWDAGSDLPDPALDAPATDTMPVAAADIALLLFTSGSTAKPKPVPLRHGCLARNGREIGRRQHLRPEDRLWIAAPFFFGYGCSNALPAVLTHGATLCMQERVAGDSLAFIEQERCTVYYGLATTTRALLADPSFGRHDISSLRTGTTGFTADDKRLAIEELGVTEVCSVYGLTEGYGHSTMTDAHDPVDVKLHTQGTVLPTQEIRIADDRGALCERGTTGEVQLRGCVIDGYLDSPDLDATSFTPDGWFRTGDLGWLDEHERLHFVGRHKEMLKVKGINIAPAEVEEILVAHADVDQAFVFGFEDRAGEAAMACAVVPRRPVPNEPAFTSELVRHMRDSAASYKVPTRFLVLSNEQLPTTDTGKVSKLLLREMLNG